MAAAEIQAGTARIYGIPGSITCSIMVAPNLSTVGLTDNFNVESIRSQNGAVIETKIGSARERIVQLEFIPSGASRANAITEAIAIIAALTPLAVITIGGCSVTSLNTTYNYESGGDIMQKRDGYVVGNVRASAVEVASAAGTFAALPIAT